MASYFAGSTSPNSAEKRDLEISSIDHGVTGQVTGNRLAAACAALRKESRPKFVSAIKLDRRSGVAK
jgi:hypothetical protein